jgi:hypothetical protein
MKRVFGLLYFAFSAVLLFAQTSRPDHPADGMPTPGTPSADHLRSLPKRFPPEMMLSPATTGRDEVKLVHSYCVHPSADGKSLSVKRCEPVPLGLGLVSPFPRVAPKKDSAK